jgi:hypothetical protein
MGKECGSWSHFATLLQSALAVKGKVKQIILAHGEMDASTTTQEYLRFNGLDNII